MANKRLSLGLDLSTQSISAVLIDVDSRDIVYRYSIDYQKDVRLNKYGIQGQNYILPPKNEGEANQPAKMFLAALDALFSRYEISWTTNAGHRCLQYVGPAARSCLSESSSSHDFG